MKALIKSYYKPTPVKWRKIGDSILVAGTIISTTMLAEYEKAKELFGVADLKHFVVFAIILTVIGKILTNFCADVPEVTVEQIEPPKE